MRTPTSYLQITNPSPNQNSKHGTRNHKFKLQLGSNPEAGIRYPVRNPNSQITIPNQKSSSNIGTLTSPLLKVTNPKSSAKSEISNPNSEIKLQNLDFCLIHLSSPRAVFFQGKDRQPQLRNSKFKLRNPKSKLTTQVHCLDPEIQTLRIGNQNSQLGNPN